MWTPSLSQRESLEFQVLEPRFNDAGEIDLRYTIRDVEGGETAQFVEQIRLPGQDVGVSAEGTVQRWVRLLALAASTSYYKALIPPRFVVEWALTDGEREFLTDLLRQGLAEFAYRNNVPEALRPQIVAESAGSPDDGVAADVEDAADGNAAPAPARALVAVGGGKDSIVSIETLRRLPVQMSLFSVNEYAPIRATADQAGIELLVATRRLDSGLFELNSNGALNGHVPVTAINSLIACLSALRLGYDAVIFSNESSSSSGNVEWEGVDVNHQWSKGVEFEGALREVLGAGGVEYFSMLRPLTELAIARRFARLTDYHSVFTSCNRAFHLDPQKRRLWCGECPKCRFVFLILGPFLPREQLLAIFSGRDLFADPAQREGFLELLNVGGRLKPFECVGEVNECRAAVTMLLEHPDWADHPFLTHPEIAGTVVPQQLIEGLFAGQAPHFVPASFEEALREVH